ncbi:DUF4041 domain-containing protein [Spirillospora sp. NPDC048911]|uniref:DUF4041 domain-containing protein n=1 Tax=Spirillospora sp. NPDC048911 TaxID=3364527 RepID=UPI00371EEF90
MVFGKGRQVQGVEAEVHHLRAQNQALYNDNVQLNAWIDRVGVMQYRDVALGIERLRAEAEAMRAGADQQIAHWWAEAQAGQARERDAAKAQLAAELADLSRQKAHLQEEVRGLERKLSAARKDIVETDDIALLQSAGVYQFQHPLDDAVAYKDALAGLRRDMKNMVRQGDAVTATNNWLVDGSAAKGRKMVKEFSKLMLRAYNAEADNLVRTMRPHKLASSRERLDKAVTAIEKLGAMLMIKVDRGYHRLRIRELQLVADYQAKVEEEKEANRAAREAQREAEKAQRELERERERLLKEQAHLRRALERLEPGAAGVAEIRAKLEELGGAITDVEAREANIRAGYVYVISNYGAFGENMVKIGMTRRLEPMDRVRELGDASVPFRFDVHAMIFSEDAVGLEGELHKAFARQRVNQVNLRREFFYATPAQVRAKLAKISGNHLLEYRDTADAEEWRASGSRSG